MNIFLDVVGCRLNQSEMEKVGNIFRALGHVVVANPSDADLAIINTCAVTVKAAADSRKKLRRAGRLGAPRVVATGCWATLYPQIALDLKGVTDVIPNEVKDTLVSILTGVTQEEIASLNLVREALPGDRARTRAFIKVQEGCNNNCAYCLTRVARGRSRSRPLGEILGDIDAALAGGAKEVVLTGVQLGAWGKDFFDAKSPYHLLDGVLTHGGFKRLRLSSIEPWDFDRELLTFWKDARLCRHLHIPLQSGSDRILKAMKRPITSQKFQRLLAMIRSEIPDIAITTDMIVGFPSENEEDFLKSCQFVRRNDFSGGHVFSYSPRPGTDAYTKERKIPVITVKSRNESLRQVFFEMGNLYKKKFLGSELSVLWETADQVTDKIWRLSGLSDNYLRLYASSDLNLWNNVTKVIVAQSISEENKLWCKIKS